MYQIAILCAGSLLLAACAREAPDPRTQGSAAHRLKPVTTPLTDPVVRRTVYVPIYSSIYWGLNQREKPVELAATVSIRNVSSRHRLVLESVRYYDSGGKQVREYINAPAELGALATVEYVIPQRDTAGGPGANFLVRWAGSAEMDEPLIEAVMVGQIGSAGISFTSPGRVVKDDRRP